LGRSLWPSNDLDPGSAELCNGNSRFGPTASHRHHLGAAAHNEGFWRGFALGCRQLRRQQYDRRSEQFSYEQMALLDDMLEADLAAIELEFEQLRPESIADQSRQIAPVINYVNCWRTAAKRRGVIGQMHD
jgi:hypothetical protein